MVGIIWYGMEFIGQLFRFILVPSGCLCCWLRLRVTTGFFLLPSLTFQVRVVSFLLHVHFAIIFRSPHSTFQILQTTDTEEKRASSIHFPIYSFPFLFRSALYKYWSPCVKCNSHLCGLLLLSLLHLQYFLYMLYVLHIRRRRRDDRVHGAQPSPFQMK